MKRTICEECKGKVENRKEEYILYGHSLGKFLAQVCTECGEVCFEETESKKITAKAKDMGLWDLSSKTKVGEVGDALDIRLNKRMVDFLGIQKGHEVTIYPINKHKIEVTF